MDARGAKMSRTGAADVAAQVRCSEMICESCPNGDFATSRAPHLVFSNPLQERPTPRRFRSFLTAS